MRNYGTGRLSSRPNVSGCSDRCCMTKRAGAFGSEIEEEDYGARKRLRLDEGPPHVSWKQDPGGEPSKALCGRRMPTPEPRPRQPQTNTRKCGNQPADKSLQAVV